MTGACANEINVLKWPICGTTHFNRKKYIEMLWPAQLQNCDTHGNSKTTPYSTVFSA